MHAQIHNGTSVPTFQASIEDGFGVSLIVMIFDSYPTEVEPFK